MGFERHIKELLKPSAYPEAPQSVELRQTHISYLFLTPRFVYKIKKAVDFGFLDFTTLEKRQHFCDEEVRLNRRLAPDVYIGVVEIKEKEGRLVIEGGEGKAIEYAVKMRRVAEDTILEERIREDTVTTKDIKLVAKTLAGFHKEAGRGPHISAFGAPRIIAKNIEENFTQIGDFVGNFLSSPSYESLQASAENFLTVNKTQLLGRVEQGFIRDCHGDIHSEHISIDNGIEIIDCIEFNERFRYCDTISDMAFLSMDLDFHNRSDLAGILEDTYLAASGDPAGKGLINFYKSYRAVIRGKVEGLKAREKEVDIPERHEAGIKAARYFDLARSYGVGAPRPRLIIICGLSGSGKSTLAAALGKVLWAPPLATDRVRRELSVEKKKTKKTAAYGEGQYSRESRIATYGELIRQGCAKYLQKGRSVILDATFSENFLLHQAIDMAGKAGLRAEDIFIFECRLDNTTLLERIRRRERGGAAPKMPLSEMREDIFKAHEKAYEKKEGNITPLNTARPLEENLDIIIKALLWR